jgi:hypothetical protein
MPNITKILIKIPFFAYNISLYDIIAKTQIENQYIVAKEKLFGALNL